MSEQLNNYTTLPDEVFALAQVKARRAGKLGWRYYEEAKSELAELALAGFHIISSEAVGQLANTHSDEADGTTSGWWRERVRNLVPNVPLDPDPFGLSANYGGRP